MEASAERQEANQSRWGAHLHLHPHAPPHPPPHPHQLLLPHHQPPQPVQQAQMARPYWNHLGPHMQAEAGANGSLDGRLTAAQHVLPPHLEHTSPPYAKAAAARGPEATLLAPPVPPVPPPGASSMHAHHHPHHLRHPHHQAMLEHPSPATPDSRFPMHAQAGAAGAEAWQAWTHGKACPSPVLDAANASPFLGVQPSPHGAGVQRSGAAGEEAAMAGGVAYLEMLPPPAHAASPPARVLCIAQLEPEQLEGAIGQLLPHQCPHAVQDTVDYMRACVTDAQVPGFSCRCRWRAPLCRAACPRPPGPRWL